MKLVLSLAAASVLTSGCAHLYGAGAPEPVAAMPAYESNRAPASVAAPKNDVQVSPCANDPGALFVKFSGEGANTVSTFVSSFASPVASSVASSSGASYPITCSATECSFVMKNKKIMSPEKAHCQP